MKIQCSKVDVIHVLVCAVNFWCNISCLLHTKCYEACGYFARFRFVFVFVQFSLVAVALIVVEFDGHIVQQIVGIPIGPNCAQLLADSFLYSCEAEFIQSLLKKGDKVLARSLNFTNRYIDDVLSLNNDIFSEYLNQIYCCLF